MNLLSIKDKISPSQEKTNITHPFTIPNGINKLVVKYEYTPKTVENQENALNAIVNGLKKYDVDVANAQSFLPINNLVTLSFDENGEYRGACHRHPNKQEINIAAQNSTKGIINRPVEAGEWDVMVNVHYVGCDVCYSIEIEGEE